MISSTEFMMPSVLTAICSHESPFWGNLGNIDVAILSAMRTFLGTVTFTCSILS